ncbi:hypothetical protein O181_081679 [Austropuccinia psidii MF-1]|uniref:Uncharacterized protein n=1 Tax=Austropuccinia psidii MF-1 TaxID=1389203 RepID=A0A9Q3FMT1_9BASI|nr:hypothetical protein [Austropuccinia psidii MF-1]
MPLISEPKLELSMITSNRDKINSKGCSNGNLFKPVKAVLHCVQGQRFGNVATNPPRNDELLAYPGKIPQRGGNSKIPQWMESAIIQASNEEDKGTPF